MTALFLDTSYIIALENLDDQNHKTASTHWKKLLKKLTPLITSSYVFNETVTFFNSRGLHNKAAEVGNNLLSSRFIDLIQVDEALFNEGWEYLQQHNDKLYSLTDCVSFVLMKQINIQEALTFDVHFQQAGFIKTP